MDASQEPLFYIWNTFKCMLLVSFQLILFSTNLIKLNSVRYLKRGDLKLTLFSPSGTRSVLLPPRPQDFNANGFHKWPFLSVQQWGEDPRGTWLLMVESVTTNPAATGENLFKCIHTHTHTHREYAKKCIISIRTVAKKMFDQKVFYLKFGPKNTNI